jgi:hypothetical protein
MGAESEWLAALARSSREMDEQAARQMEGLTVEQLNWRPDPETWSVLQQFHHVVLANRPYIGIMERLAGTAGPHRSGYRPGFWGKLMLKMVGPDETISVSVPKPLVPSEQPMTLDVVAEYRAIQDRYHGVMKVLDGKDLNGKLTSPFAKFVRLKLGDALHMMERHNARHLDKAIRLMERPDFPR